MKNARIMALCIALLLCAAASAATLRLPDCLTRIDDEAFAGDKSLDRVVVPEGVEEIGTRAFANSSIQSLTLPESLVSMADDALKGCKGVKITAPEGSYAEQWAAEYDEKATPTEAFLFLSYSTQDGGITMGDYVSILRYIGTDRDVIIPSTYIGKKVTGIHDKAFLNCTDVTSVTIPDSVSTIGVSAFEGCTNLKRVKIPDSVNMIREKAFLGCTSLENVKIPDSVSLIGSATFQGCTSLKSVKIPDNVTQINGMIFSECTGLKSVSIPDGVKSIMDRAFYKCTSLASVKLPDSLTQIRDSAFRECESLTHVTIPKNVDYIGDMVFYSCTGLKSVTITNGVRTIEQGQFEHCTSLESVAISDSVTSIERSAFSDCVSLTNVNIPGSVLYIAREAFSDCTNLASATISSNLTRIYDHDEPFARCPNLTIYGVAESYADYYARHNRIPFIPIADQPFILNAEAKQGIYFLGAGQELYPTFEFSDGKEHSYTTIGCNVVLGGSVEPYLKGVKGVELGESTVEGNLMLNENESGITLNAASRPRFRVQVAYRLPYEALTLGRGDVVHIWPEIYSGEYNEETLVNDITWSSDNEEVLTVGQGGGIGTLYPLANGTATVTMEGALGATCTMKVKVVDPPTSVSFTHKGPLTLGTGEEKHLSVKFPAGQHWFNVEYASNDSGVATVSQTGLLKAEKAGVAIVTATAGKVKATLKVEVKNAPTGIHFARNGKEITDAIVIKGLHVQLPEVVLEGEDPAGKESIAYWRNSTPMTGRSFLADRNCTIYARTYNDKEAKLTVKVETDETLVKLQNWYAALNRKGTGAKAKLVKKVNLINQKKKGTLNAIGKDFDTVKRQWAVSDKFNKGVDGINVASTDFSGGVERALKLMLYEEMAKADSKIEGLSTSKDEKAMMKQINELIKGYKQKKTVNVDGTIYTFTFEDIGSYKLGAKFLKGDVTVTKANGGKEKFPFGASVTQYSRIQSFMKELEALAKAQMTKAVKEAISGGLKDMGIDEGLEYMRKLNAESAPVKALLEGMLEGNATEGLGKVLAELVLNDGSYFEQIVKMDDQWKKFLKSLPKTRVLMEYAVMDALGANNVLSLDDVDDIKKTLKESSFVIDAALLINDFDPEETGKKIDEVWDGV